MIPFRRQRLATSVVNRIFNIYEGIQQMPKPSAVPAAPQALPEGGRLDAKLATAPQPVDADSATAAEIALSSLTK